MPGGSDLTLPSSVGSSTGADCSVGPAYLLLSVSVESASLSEP